MNQKNSLGLDNCFNDLENPIELFNEWFNEAKKSEINDPNAFALATANKSGIPSVRMLLLKDFNEEGFVFYTNIYSNKMKEIHNTGSASMCFHWKSLQRQVRVFGNVFVVSDTEADNYFNSRPYGSKIGAWASMQSSLLISREELNKSIEEYKKKYPENVSVPRPKHWTGFRLKHIAIEFWLNGENRIHERLLYERKGSKWQKVLLSP